MFIQAIPNWPELVTRYGLPVAALIAIALVIYKKFLPLAIKHFESSQELMRDQLKSAELARRADQDQLLKIVADGARERGLLTDRLTSMESQLAVLGVQVKPLWAAVEAKIAKDLTHPNAQFQEMDELLRRLTALTITVDERARLHDLLKERTTSLDPEVSSEERDSAKLMLVVMDKVLQEAAMGESLIVKVVKEFPPEKAVLK